MSITRGGAKPWSLVNCSIPIFMLASVCSVVDFLAKDRAQLLRLLVRGFFLCLQLTQPLLEPEIECVQLGVDGVLSHFVLVRRLRYRGTELLGL